MKRSTRTLILTIVTPLALWGILEIFGFLILSFVIEPRALPSVSEKSSILPFSQNLMWELRANDEYNQDGISYRTNTRGQRVMPTLGEGKAILAIGDSSTYGFGVSADQTFLAQVGDCLGLPVINGGVPGYSSVQSRLQLEGLLAENDLAWVVIANLWSDMMLAPKSDKQRLLEVKQTQEQNQKVDARFLQKSAVYRLIHSILLENKAAIPIPINAILEASEEGNARRVSAEEYADNIQSMVDMSMSAGARAIVLQLPTNRSGPHPSSFEQSDYRKGPKSSGATVVDMDKVYNELSRTLIADRFIDFVHPSALGHQEIARELCAAMQQK